MRYSVSFALEGRDFVEIESFSDMASAVSAFNYILLVAQINDDVATYKLEDSSGEVYRYVELGKS